MEGEKTQLGEKVVCILEEGNLHIGRLLLLFAIITNFLSLCTDTENVHPTIISEERICLYKVITVLQKQHPIHWKRKRIERTFLKSVNTCVLFDEAMSDFYFFLILEKREIGENKGSLSRLKALEISGSGYIF